MSATQKLIGHILVEYFVGCLLAVCTSLGWFYSFGLLVMLLLILVARTIWFEVIGGMVFSFVFAAALFAGVGWIARLPLPIRRYRAFMKFLRVLGFVVFGFLLGYSFGFDGGVRYIFNGRQSAIQNERRMQEAVQIYTSTHTNQSASDHDVE